MFFSMLFTEGIWNKDDYHGKSSSVDWKNKIK